MKVLDFDIKRGIFHFEVGSLISNHHAHPVVEVVNATEGSFLLETNTLKQEQLTFAIIDANVKHRVVAECGKIELLMVESYNTILRTFLSDNGLSLSGGMFTANSDKEKQEVLYRIKQLANGQRLKAPEDERIRHCLDIIETENLPYHELTDRLASEACLSESRLSHLFKANVGISAKKYLAWSRLKHAMHFLLSEEVSFTEAAHQSGFFDQAHLSNAFKQFLGLSPSRAYNSRILQF